ncbi:MAG: glycosyltransferase family 9 protein [Bdellovibrionales bacterium]|nr:glycosyltransferase family 9 protein [Bdellovibrionales bacterium]
MANLVIQTAFLGDLLLAIPLLKQVKRSFPNEKLYLVCRKGLGPVITELQLADVVVEVDKKKSSSIREAKKKLRPVQFTNIFCPHQSIRSALLVLSLKKKRAIGFYDWWNSWIFHSRIRRPMDLPDALRQVALVTLADSKFDVKFDGESTDFLNGGLQNYHLPIVDFREQSIPDWADMQCPIDVSKIIEKKVFLAPGSTWNTKRWGREHYIQLSHWLKDLGYQVELLGSPEERELCQSIADQVPGLQNHAGKTSLIETLALLRTGQALVCNDSGAMHMAAVVGLPTVAVFGPTTLDLGYRPWQSRAIVVQNNLLDCRPCGLHGAQRCPLGHHQCMKDLKVERVIQAFSKLLTIPESLEI